ncbi:hypothetical protein DRW41_06060 [Neobacillus piezotolerans]|uniref:Uncharacterized protein n=1 Tax=Neobacillus piezotolerans TaxID=2259171 RepID=A0A3D8GSS0_9BACI|nr:hypothetical protein [Neobacillus piezotolerans]RDU37407.1 hypothetical protein DRW41_06060 [Neobacillus piezotolerans]
MKNLMVFKQWLFLFGIGLLLGSLAILVDVVWVKKLLWITLAVLGAISMGKFYQMYEYGFDTIEKRKKK